MKRRVRAANVRHFKRKIETKVRTVSQYKINNNATIGMEIKLDRPRRSDDLRLVEWCGISDIGLEEKLTCAAAAAAARRPGVRCCSTDYVGVKCGVVQSSPVSADEDINGSLIKGARTRT